MRFNKIEKEKKEKGSNTIPLETINQEAQQKLTQILTAEQSALYQELRKDNKKQKEAYIKENPTFTFSKQDKEMDF